MRKTNFLKPVLIIATMTILIACTSNIEKIPLEIPKELHGNKKAEAIIEDMTNAVNDCRNYMQKATKLAIKQMKSGNDSLSITQGLKIAMITGKIMLSQNKIEKYHNQVDQLSQDLSESQSMALINCVNSLEDKIGEINTEELGLSDEELTTLKNGGNLDFNNQKSNVSQKKIDSIMAMRNEAIGNMKPEGNYKEPIEKPGNVIEPPLWFSIAFPIVVVGLMIFIFFMGIHLFYKKVKRTVNDLSYVKNDVLRHVEK
ncbi:hypothetical protein [Plebeiibacterium sediminum]|uniref:Uncharacterized protein n=1 Tax=Plebeiibacterium sediminum TaxID=2992112 RepID=A0AAE3M6J7_9BACT|nr:hypothetical protein [Plebeiobacterium sediminum]MCW3788144.1 hypothetical protein [Plebeiobacterium sediminum]